MVYPACLSPRCFVTSPAHRDAFTSLSALRVELFSSKSPYLLSTQSLHHENFYWRFVAEVPPRTVRHWCPNGESTLTGEGFVGGKQTCAPVPIHAWSGFSSGVLHSLISCSVFDLGHIARPPNTGGMMSVGVTARQPSIAARAERRVIVDTIDSIDSLLLPRTTF